MKFKVPNEGKGNAKSAIKDYAINCCLLQTIDTFKESCLANDLNLALEDLEEIREIFDVFQNSDFYNEKVAHQDINPESAQSIIEKITGFLDEVEKKLKEDLKTIGEQFEIVF